MLKYNSLGSQSTEFKRRLGSLNFKQAFIENYFEGEQPRCCFCGQILETNQKEDAENEEYKRRHGKYPEYSYVIADIEHIFPKSLFPQFTLHPKNWVPCCKECNQSIKRSEFFKESPMDYFKKAIEDLGLDFNNLHPLKL